MDGDRQPGHCALPNTAALLPSGKVLVAGGSDNLDGVLSSAELYDPGTARGRRPAA